MGLGVQVLVLDRDRGRGADRLDELRVVVERRVVDERGDLAPVALDRHDRPVAAGRRQRDRLAGGVGVGRAVRQRVGDLELRIAERLRERERSSSPRIGPSPRNSSARAPRASRERSRPARNAAGTVTSEHAASQSSTCERVPAMRSLSSSAVKHDRANAPARLGSSARRRGPDVVHQRAAITTTVAVHAQASRPRWVWSIACATSSSGKASSRLLPVELREQQPGELQQHERDRVGRDEPAVDARLEPPAGQEREQQRDEEEDPAVDEHDEQRRGEVAVDLAQQRRDEEREPGGGHQHAAAAVGPPAPGDQAEGGERAADEPEHDVEADDRRVAVEQDGPQGEHLGRRGRGPEPDPEQGGMAAHRETAAHVRGTPAERVGREIARDPFPRRPADHHELLRWAEHRHYPNRGGEWEE